MSIGIYMYQNKINNRIYVGQSVDIEDRKLKHESRAFHDNNTEYNSIIHKAFRKYGLNNFDFVILELCLVNELNEKEIYWIEQKNSYYDGYNATLGGNYRVYKKLNPEILEYLTKDLKEGILTNNHIAEKYGISYQQVSEINNGKAWKRDLDYPIRKGYAKETFTKAIVEKKAKKEYFCSSCGKRITDQADTGLCQECYKVASRTVERPEPLQLAKEILTLGFEGVGRKYNVSGNAIKKWCETYNMGRLKSEVAIWYANNKND